MTFFSVFLAASAANLVTLCVVYLLWSAYRGYPLGQAMAHLSRGALNTIDKVFSVVFFLILAAMGLTILGGLLFSY